MKKTGFTIGLFFMFSVALCQNFDPTARQVYKLFKLSIDQPEKGVISIGSDGWTICNQDSSFFKADTLRLYSHINYFYQKSACCDFVNWTFYKKNAFVQSTSQICREPATSSIKGDYYGLNIISKQKKTYLILKRGDKTIENFEVIEIEDIKLAQNNLAEEITLKRLKNFNDQ